MPTTIPPSLLALLPPEAEPTVTNWWATLAEGDRLGVVALWDRRHEATFFEPQTDEAGNRDDWSAVPRVRGGHFVPHDDSWGFGEWGPRYFEYLLKHPDLFPIVEKMPRIFHIGCTQHPAARACLASGGVPRDFTCPVDPATCFLQPLRGVRFRLPEGR